MAGKTYDDLIFYDRSFDSDSEKTTEEIFGELPSGTVMIDNDTFLAANISGTPQYGTKSQVGVSDMPFNTALEVEITQVPEYSYNTQLALPELTGFDGGDAMLLVLYMKTISALNEEGEGRIQCIIENPAATSGRALQENVRTAAGQGWSKYYIPFSALDNHTSLYIRLGFGLQKVQIGGFELINYAKAVDVDDLPSSSMAKFYNVKTVFTKDEAWRKDAWARIEQFRRGDINVIVKDKDGNPVKNAEVDINMYEHEFQWGTAVSNIARGDHHGDKMRAAVSSLFNSAVLENAHKWNYYEQNPGVARAHVDILKTLNLKYLRGHTLVWDIWFPNGWETSNAIPQDVYDLFAADDRSGVDARIRTHMTDITGAFPEATDWDVLNEPLWHRTMRAVYGDGVIKDWFAWARDGAGENAKLYVNEANIIGMDQGRVDRYKTLIDGMVASGADFDGIGVQGHFKENYVHPLSFYNELIRLAEYNKEIKVTEFDMGAAISSADCEYEASFMRDIMLLAFSIENMTGFTVWGFWSGSHNGGNAPIFNADWSLKESGRQFIDLVYNKWRTRESGKTDSNGEYSVKGYYGDYEITVTAGEAMKTVEGQCYKGQDNTFTIILDEL